MVGGDRVSGKTADDMLGDVGRGVGRRMGVSGETADDMLTGGSGGVGRRMVVSG